MVYEAFNRGLLEKMGVRFYRVVVIEDNERYLKDLREDLPAAGHEIVAEASTPESAKALIDRFDEIKPDAVLLDGTLDESRATRSDVERGRDGEEIYALIKRLHPNIPVIPFTKSLPEWGDTPLVNPPSKIHWANKQTLDVGDWVTKIVEGTPIV